MVHGESTIDTDPQQLELAAIRTFDRLADAWQLTPTEHRRWLGGDLDPPPSTDERLDRMSYALGIYKALHQLFADDGLADGWIRRHNTAFGQGALDHALAGGIQGMREVRQHLDAQVIS